MTEYRPEDYIRYRIQRAHETIAEVESHVENKFWNTALNRMYYACFYAIGALLALHQIRVTSHQGLRLKFGEHFVKTGIIDKELGKMFTELFDRRCRGDYEDFFDHDEETVLRMLPRAKELINVIDNLLQDLQK